MRHAHILTSLALVASSLLSGCVGEDSGKHATADHSTIATLTVPSGTSLDVTIGTSLTTKDANVGDAWSGTVTNGATVAGKHVIPAGSAVTGKVSAVAPARKGDRAMLDLQLTSITVGDNDYPVQGGMEAIVAGSTRARNLGAIAGSAAAGALIGKAVSGTGKGAVVGGVAGAGVATAVVAGSDGYQVVLNSGTPLTFTTSSAVAVRH